jgi:D-3-phosphoglycerate dehydrogenase
MKVVIADKVSPSALKVFADGDWTVVSPDKESLARELADAEAIVVRSATFVDDAMMEKAPKLRVIGRAGVGVDNVDLDAATRRGIVVMNTPGGNAVAVAEHTFALMLAMARFIPRAHATTAAGKWEKRCREPNCAAKRWALSDWDALVWKCCGARRPSA